MDIGKAINSILQDKTFGDSGGTILIEDCLREYIPEFEEKSVTVRVKDGLGGRVVFMDPSRIMVVVRNIVDNSTVARDYDRTLELALKGVMPFSGRHLQHGDETQSEKNMELIYPFHNTKIYVPVELSGKLGKTVFEAAHRNKNAIIFWYVDDKLVRQTKGIHQIELSPPEGEHILTLIDETGEKLMKKFEIIGRH